MVDPDDIIDAIRQGSRWAAPAMVTLVSPVLLGYAATVAPDLTPADHEAAAEEAILRGVRKLDRFDRRRGTFAGWLRPFVRHELANIRRHRGIHAVPLPDDLPDEPSLEPTDEGKEAEATAISAALRTLTDTDRLIINLRDYEHLNYEQCAERIGGVSAAACRVRHHRALRRLVVAARQQQPLAHYFEDVHGQD